MISPYRARARRVAHLFACSLQDGDFPRRDTGGPLLSDEARAALALPERKKAEVEDRYLFSVCLAPEAGSGSWRSADDEGGATARSPFVDEARELLAPELLTDTEERTEALVAEAGGGLAESVFSIGAAPSEDELARAEAADGSATTVEAAVRERLDDRLSAARDRIAAPPATGSAQPRAGSRAPAGTRSVRPVDPGGIRGVPLPLVRRSRAAAAADRAGGGAAHAGQVAHQVLERLYADPPAPEGRPTPATLLLAAWLSPS